MTAWLAQAPFPLLAFLIFLTLYLVAALVLGVLVLARRHGHLSSFGPLSPGLLSPMGLIFGLLVGFLVADVLDNHGQAVDAVSQEASALRDADLLIAAFPAQQGEVQKLLQEQIDHYVADEWPLMSRGEASLAVAPPGLIRVQTIALGVPVRVCGSSRLILADGTTMLFRRGVDAPATACAPGIARRP